MVVLREVAFFYERGTPATTSLDVKYGRSSTLSSRTMYSLDGFRKSPPPQNRQLIVLISTSERPVKDFVGELTF